MRRGDKPEVIKHGGVAAKKIRNTQCAHKHTPTCPSLGCRRCSVNPSTCPRTPCLWAACTVRTLLRSCRSREAEPFHYILVHIKAVEENLLCLPSLEDHVVCETCQNWSQNTGVFQELWRQDQHSRQPQLLSPQLFDIVLNCSNVVSHEMKGGLNKRNVTHRLQQPWVVCLRE